MKIPSVKKIYAQAENYAKHIKIPKEILDKIEELEYNKILPVSKFRHEIEQHCPTTRTGNGKDCNCVLHPLYKSISDEIEKIDSELRILYNQRNLIRKKAYQEYIHIMMTVRENKIKVDNENFR
jgi:hypothetical protein